MRAVVDRKDFEEVLTKAKPATEKRASLPVLNNYKLSAKTAPTNLTFAMAEPPHLIFYIKFCYLSSLTLQIEM
jgi:hypothetical protein